MSHTVPLDEAQHQLRELIGGLAPGDEIILTDNLRPIARLLPAHPGSAAGLRPPPGLGKGYLTIIADDDEHLNDFGEYMP